MNDDDPAADGMGQNQETTVTEQQLTIELWKNAMPGVRGIKRYPQAGVGGLDDESIRGGAEFRITPQERAMNEGRAASEGQCPFRNSTFTFLRYVQGGPTPTVTDQALAAAQAPPAAPGAGSAALATPPPPVDAATEAVATPTGTDTTPAPTPAEAPPAPGAPSAVQLTAEDFETIVNGDHRAAYPKLAKITAAPILARLHARAVELDNPKRADRIRARWLEVDPAAVVPTRGPATAIDDGMPPADQYDPDTGQATTHSPADEIDTDEPGSKIVYDPDDDQPVFFQDGRAVDGSALMLPGSTVPEGLPAPAAYVPDEVPGTVV